MHSSPLTVLEEFERDCHRAGGKARLDDLLSWLDFTTCADPRDSIYALLALIDWDASGLEPIAPDYDRTAYSLALQLLPNLRPYSWRRVMRMLNIDASIEMRGLLMARSWPFSSMPSRENRVHQITFDRVSIARFHAGDNGGLRVATMQEQEHQVHLPGLKPESTEPAKECAIHDANDLSMSSVLEVQIGDQVAALLSRQCRPGDLLISLPSPSTTSCLTIRPTGDSKLDVVGQGVVVHENIAMLRHGIRATAFIDNDLLPEDDIFLANLQLHASAEDIAVLCHGVGNAAYTGQDGPGDAMRLRRRPIEAFSAQPDSCHAKTSPTHNMQSYLLSDGRCRSRLSACMRQKRGIETVSRER